MLKHICGQCGKTFSTEADYLKHHCQGVSLQPEPLVASPTEKNILAAVRAARRAKQYNA